MTQYDNLPSCFLGLCLPELGGSYWWTHLWWVGELHHSKRVISRIPNFCLRLIMCFWYPMRRRWMMRRWMMRRWIMRMDKLIDWLIRGISLLYMLRVDFNPSNRWEVHLRSQDYLRCIAQLLGCSCTVQTTESISGEDLYIKKVGSAFVWFGYPDFRMRRRWMMCRYRGRIYIYIR